MYLVDEARIRNCLINQWATGEVQVPHGKFWDVIFPDEALRLGQSALEAGNLEVHELVLQTAFNRTVNDPNEAIQLRFAKVYGTLQIEYPSSTRQQG